MQILRILSKLIEVIVFNRSSTVKFSVISFKLITEYWLLSIIFKHVEHILRLKCKIKSLLLFTVLWRWYSFWMTCSRKHKLGIWHKNRTLKRKTYSHSFYLFLASIGNSFFAGSFVSFSLFDFAANNIMHLFYQNQADLTMKKDKTLS